MFRRSSFILLIALTCTAHATKWDDTKKNPWPDDFKRVSIPSSVDNTRQRAYYRKSSADNPMPLLVSLHTWSGDYAQQCELAPMAAEADWHYIHPNFRGPNKTPDACLSPKALADIDDAIAYAVEKGNVDPDNIFVVGTSGGGYATLGCFIRLRHHVKAFLAWVPISDLEAWYWQSHHRNSKYADHILQATSDGQAPLNVTEARRRSPLHWDLPETPNGHLEIYAGIRDGYEGSVPITHSILFYNKAVTHFGDASDVVTEKEIIQLLSNGISTLGDKVKIDDRTVLFYHKSGPVSLTIFDGKHEMLPRHCFKRLIELAE